MRPRYLLLLINHCRGYTVNYGHGRIEEADIKRGLEAYSSDLSLTLTRAELRGMCVPTGVGARLPLMKCQSSS